MAAGFMDCRVPALIAITGGGAGWCFMPDAHEWIEQGGQAAQDVSYRSRLLPLVLGHDGYRPNRKNTEEDRILSEMMEMAQALQGQALISKQDMARMNLICQNPPEYTSENVTLIRVEKAKVSQSVFASMLNVSVSAVQIRLAHHDHGSCGLFAGPDAIFLAHPPQLQCSIVPLGMNQGHDLRNRHQREKLPKLPSPFSPLHA